MVKHKRFLLSSNCAWFVQGYWLFESLLAEDSGQAKKAKTEVETKTETTEPISSTAISSTVTLSEPLGKFFGTGETEMADEEIIRRVWEYIKLNNLEVMILILKSSGFSLLLRIFFLFAAN